MGISIDLGAIDPEDAPGVETPAPSGIKAIELLEALSLTSQHPKLLIVRLFLRKVFPSVLLEKPAKTIYALWVHGSH